MSITNVAACFIFFMAGLCLMGLPNIEMPPLQWRFYFGTAEFLLGLGSGVAIMPVVVSRLIRRGAK